MVSTTTGLNGECVKSFDKVLTKDAVKHRHPWVELIISMVIEI